jgi:putative endonuclease
LVRAQEEERKNPQLDTGDFFMEHFVYILHSVKLNRFYIGETINLTQRLEFHKNSPSSKFTGKAGDWTLFLEIKCTSKNQALHIEKHIKKMKSKTYIENLKKFAEISQKLKARYH